MARLLLALSDVEWHQPPLGTRAATILACRKRGLIEMRPRMVGWLYDRYADYEMRKIPSRKK